MEWYLLIHDGDGSIEGSSGWYLVVLGHEKAVPICTRWYWVSRRRYWLILDGGGDSAGEMNIDEAP